MKPVIYCPNHSSYFDIPILYYVLPPEVCFLGKSELSQVPVFGPIFNRVHISVKRNSAKQGVESLKKASEMLKRGRSVVIFPEGTIKADIQPHLLPFKDGAFRLAILTQRPIVPVYMPYNHDFMPDDGRFYPHWRPLQAHIGEPINPSDFKNEESLKNATEEAIKALRALHYPMLETKPLA